VPAKERDPITQALVDRRLALGWSQNELAVRSGVNRSTISEVEAMKHGYTVDSALKLAKAMGAEFKLVDIEPMEVKAAEIVKRRMKAPAATQITFNGPVVFQVGGDE